MISVTKITKTFGDIKAVDELSFDIAAGEIVGLLGPNGAGKTTTMRVISGYYAPDNGDVKIDGVSVIEDTIAVQQMLGYLPENNPIYLDMLVSDFLTYSGELRGLKGKDLKDGIAFVVKSVHLEDVFYRPIKELSKGYKQRVGIAAALLHKPKVLILDEPTEGLDPIQRNEIRMLIKDLAKEHTIVISTHVMQEVSAICTRMIIIDNGKLIVDGSVAELSKGVGNEKVYDVTLEGKDIEKHLKALEYLQMAIVSKEGNKISVRLTVAKDKFVEPTISKLAKENDWIIWQMSTQIRELEEVFRELTKSGSNL